MKVVIPVAPAPLLVDELHVRIPLEALLNSATDLAAEGGIGRGAVVRGRERIKCLAVTAGPIIDCGAAKLNARGDGPGPELVGIEGIEQLLGTGIIFGKDACLGGGEELIHGGLGFRDCGEFAAGGGGAAEDAASDAPEEADAGGAGLAVLVLFHEEGVEGVEGVGGLAGVEGGFGHEADGFFAEGFVAGGAFEVGSGGDEIFACEGGVALFHGAAGDCCGGHHCGA